VDPHLSPLAEVMPGVIGTAALLVWIVLIGVGLGTLWRVRRDPGQVDTTTSSDVGSGTGASRGDPVVNASRGPQG
jgi:hypothetical protein